MFPGVTLALLVLPSLLDLSASATQASERISEAVELKLYPMQVSDWSTTKETDFATALASQATTYCAASQLACGASNTLTFTSAEVGVSSLEDSSKSMSLTFYLDYPGSPTFYSNSSTQYVLPASVAREIAGDVRDSIKDLTGAYITYVDNKYYGIPPDSTMNAIIIPITIVTVCMLGIIAIILVNRQKSQEREETIRARQAEKKKYGTTQGGGPSYNILESTDTTFMSTPTTPRNAPGSNKVAPDSYAIWTGESEAAQNKPSTTPSFAAPLPQDSGGAVPLAKNGSLTPLYSAADTQTVDEDEVRREKKRKKERKREKRRLQNDSLEMNNSGLDNSCLTVTDSDSRSNIPTFTVERGTIA